MTVGFESPVRGALGAPDSTPPLPPAPAVQSAAARRRVSRKSLALSVLVVLLGGLLAFTAAQMLTAHDEVLAVARDVEVGSTISADDLTVADVSSDPALSPIPADDLSRVVGMVAQVPLSQGELLTPAQVGTGTGLPLDQVLVALPLQDGQFPARGLSPGEKILIVATPGTAGATTEEASTGTSVPFEATVAEVGQANLSTQVAVVDVLVAEDAGPALARLASTGNLAIIVLPAGD